MKKLISLLLSLALVFSLTSTAFAKSDNANSNSSNNSKVTEEKQNGDQSSKKDSNAKKAFKAELNAERKTLIEQKSALNQEMEQLQTEYEACLAEGDTAGAETIMAQIKEKNSELETLKNQIKQAVNERYMLVKTLYSDEELAEFDSAADLIAQMYEDAYTLGAGSVTVNNNIIKFEAPPYIKGGKTIVPVRAITEAMGAEVSWDPETETVTITKDDTTVEMTVGDTTVSVNGVAVETTAPDISCGKTYIPLRFLAETFGFDVTWDGEDEIIDIDDEADAEEDTGEDAEENTGDAGTGEPEETDSGETAE
ncbi:MAG: copper amine oxidase N-terminal domain-containing protein [Oscillospiraceae bacterium]